MRAPITSSWINLWGSRILAGFLLILLYSPVAGQVTNDLNNRYSDPLGINKNQNSTLYGQQTPSVLDNNTPSEQGKDSTKKPKIRLPLESYFFPDSVRERPNFVWTLDMDRNNINLTDVDTLLNNFQNDVPFMKEGIGAAYLGNLGAPSISLNYFDRPEYRDFTFTEALDAYLFTPENVRFYNVKSPFTQFQYIYSGQTKYLEENFRITHAQNISPSSGFNIDYKSMGDRGKYTNSGTREKNLSIAFNHTGKKYTLHAGYIYNMADLEENGGVVRDSDITDTIFELPELIDVNLENAKSIVKQNTFYLVQSYGAPLQKLQENDFSIADKSTLFVGQSTEYSRTRRNYTDTKSMSGDYYENWFIDPTTTHDSIFESLLSNKAFVQIQPWNRYGAIGLINAGIGNDMHHYYHFSSMDSYLQPNEGTNRNETYVYGSLEGYGGKYFKWEADTRYHLLGDRSQDIYLGGKMTFNVYSKSRPLTLTAAASFDNRTPGYWSENYFSNHFAWSNSFTKEIETRFDVEFAVPHLGIQLGGSQSITQDRIYFDASGVPAQYDGSVSVSGVYAQKEFRLGGLRLNNRVLLQHSTAQEVAPVPMASIYLSYFYEFWVVRDVLRLQTGLDGRYNTEYYAFGYNPATMQFYNQQVKKLGNYPVIDFFVSAKWKRMRILAKLQHLNDGLIGENNSFMVLGYPLNKMAFKLGISWTFYD